MAFRKLRNRDEILENYEIDGEKFLGAELLLAGAWEYRQREYRRKNGEFSLYCHSPGDLKKPQSLEELCAEEMAEGFEALWDCFYPFAIDRDSFDMPQCLAEMERLLGRELSWRQLAACGFELYSLRQHFD